MKNKNGNEEKLDLNFACMFESEGISELVKI